MSICQHCGKAMYVLGFYNTKKGRKVRWFCKDCKYTTSKKLTSEEIALLNKTVAKILAKSFIAKEES